MRDRIGEVLSRLLSEKHDAKIKITFKERETCNTQTKSSKN